MANLKALVNLVQNPSAEVDAAGWTVAANGSGATATIGRQTAWAWAGQYSFQATLTAGATTNYMYLGHSGGANYCQVTGGQTYTLQAQVRLLLAGRALIRVDWYNGTTASPTLVALGNPTTMVDLAAATPTELRQSFVAPATATMGRVLIHAYPASGQTYVPVGQTMLVDAIMVHPGEEPQPYVDGSLGPLFGWDGTAHASTSYRKALVYSGQASYQRGVTTVTAELWRHTLANVPVDDLTPMALEGKVSVNIHNTIKSAFTLKARNLELVKPYVDCLAPFLVLTEPDGTSTRHQLGLFTMVPPKQEHTPELTTGTLEGRDVLARLDSMSFDTVTTMAQGGNILTFVGTLCAAAGVAYNLPVDASATLPAPRTLKPTDSWLVIANQLLNDAGYYTLWATRQGVVTTRKYFTLADAEPALALFSGEGGNVLNTITQEGVYDTIANRVVIFKDDPNGTPIVATRTNSDPTSPTSTVALGRTITRWLTDTQIVSQAVADETARRLMEEESANYTSKLRVTTLPLPERGMHEVYDLAIYNDVDAVVAFGKWWCDGYEIGFNVGTGQVTMVHNLKRLEPYGA